MNGKGDKRRPMRITQEEYRKRWEEAFGKQEKEKDDEDTESNSTRK